MLKKKKKKKPNQNQKDSSIYSRPTLFLCKHSVLLSQPAFDFFNVCLILY